MTPRLPRRLAGLPRAVWVLVAGTLITRAGSFVVPFLTIYLHRERGLSLSAAGVALGAWGAGGMIASLSGGSLADRLGRKPVIAGSPILGGLAVVALLFTQAPLAVVAVAFCAGVVAEAGRPAVSAMLTDLTPYERRIDAFALFRLAINLGFAVGTGLGGLLITHFGFARLFVADAATSWIYAAIALMLLPETKPERVATDDTPAPGFKAVVADPTFRRFWIATFFAALVFTQPMATLALVLTGRGLSMAVYGALISMNGVIIIGAEFWISGRSRRYAPPKVMALGALLLGVGFTLTAGAGRAIPLLVGTVAVWTLGEMLGSPTSQAYLGAIAPPDLRGRYAGGLGLAWSLAFTVGPFLGTTALSYGGPALWVGCLVLAAVSAGLFLTLPVPVAPGAVPQPPVVPVPMPVPAQTARGRLLPRFARPRS